MILRKFTRHVTDQNWFAVGLDVIVVITGIFLGMQVTEWNEERQRRNDERTALFRLQAESVAVVEWWQQQVYSSERDNVSRRLFLEILEAGEVAADERGAVDDAILRMTHYATNNPPSSVYDEMIASGGLRLISDADARNAVSNYAEKLGFINGQLTQFRIIIPVLDKAYEGKIISVYAPEKPSLRQYKYDIAALSKDIHFKSSMVDGVRDQIQFHNYRTSALKAAVKMCEEVSRAVSMACEVEEISLSKIAAMDDVNQ